ncbi:unnamed protein product [Urochloa humidicola]
MTIMSRYVPLFCLRVEGSPVKPQVHSLLRLVKEQTRTLGSKPFLFPLPSSAVGRVDAALRRRVCDVLRRRVCDALRHRIHEQHLLPPRHQVPAKIQWLPVGSRGQGSHHRWQEKYLKAKVSRGKVKYPHKTGSRCYIAQTYAVVRLEAIVAEPTEGKDPKTATEVVLGIIKVVQNVCLETAAPKKSDTSTVRARVQGLEAEVQAEREDSAAQRRQIEYQQNQFESLKSKFEEFGAHNQKQQEMGSLEKQGETESI